MPAPPANLDRSAASVRKPAVAGVYYPADPGGLAMMVDGLMGPDADDRPAPQALVVPHACYLYSGPIAAKAFARLRRARGRVRRVVLIGPAHGQGLQGIALPRCGSFATPLGSVPVDGEATARIATLPQVAFDDRPHAAEHAIEIQLPFLQRAIGDFALVPLLVGEVGAAAVAAVVEALWDEEDTLVVVSTDLSHYHSRPEARRLDAATAAAVECFDGGSLKAENACCHIGLAALLDVAEERGLSVARVDVRNSGDTMGSPACVVGYGAWALYA